MTEQDPTRTQPVAEQPFINDPRTVIADYLSRVGEPSPGAIQAAAVIIHTSYPR